jgi:hypothetical protein
LELLSGTPETLEPIPDSPMRKAPRKRAGARQPDGPETIAKLESRSSSAECLPRTTAGSSQYREAGSEIIRSTQESRRPDMQRAIAGMNSPKAGI